MFLFDTTFCDTALYYGRNIVLEKYYVAEKHWLIFWDGGLFLFPQTLRSCEVLQHIWFQSKHTQKYESPAHDICSFCVTGQQNTHSCHFCRARMDPVAETPGLYWLALQGSPCSVDSWWWSHGEGKQTFQGQKNIKHHLTDMTYLCVD